MTDLEIMGAREALQQCDDADTDWSGALAVYLESALAEIARLRAEFAKAQSAAACTGCSVPLGDSWCAQCASAVNEARIVTLIEAALVGRVEVPDNVSAEVARMVRAVRINVVMRERHAAIVEAAKAWRDDGFNTCDLDRDKFDCQLCALKRAIDAAGKP